MAVDTPATIAIVGAGPIGLESALYARFLGYDVLVFERDAIASNVARCGSTPMFTPFAANSSSLGLAALHAQDTTYQPPGPDQRLTASDWVDRYLLPLANTDLLEGKIHVGHRVLAIGRPDALKTDPVNDHQRADQSFHLLVTSEQGEEQLHSAEVVIDASGVHGEPGGLGPGGLPAPGERAVRANIDYHPRDWLGAARDDYANRHVLVCGDGLLAGRAVIALSQLAVEAPDTRITWITRRGEQNIGPLAARPDDPVPERMKVFDTANRLACDGHPSLRWAPGHALAAISYDDQRRQFRVALTGDLKGEQQALYCDRVVADVPFHSDLSLLRELHVTPCPVDESIGGRDGGAASRLVLDEPDFYVLGAKSWGRAGDFLYTAGLEQIRELFAIVGDRADLDLYANALKLPR